MRIFFTFIISLIIICVLFLFSVKDKFNINQVLNKIQNDTNINILLKDNVKWGFYPEISYQNDISLINKDKTLIIEQSNISINRKYWLTSPFKISFDSPSILYKGLNFRNSKIISEYQNDVYNINKFTANLIDGNININGFINSSQNTDISLSGTYKNISLNRVLKQLNIAEWERVKIKISSPEFKISTTNGTKEKIIENLNGEMNISGSVFFVSTEEERFGAAFLSLLADKIANMMSLSKSINYLLNKFADKPSNISGKIIIDKGILSTKKLLLNNKKGKALISATLDIKTNIINGKIDLYENDIILLTTELRGNLKNPEILVGGEILGKNSKSKPQNIKDIFEIGINSLIDSIINPDE